MHENLMRLKQTVSPVRGSTQPGFTSFNEGLQYQNQQIQSSNRGVYDYKP